MIDWKFKKDAKPQGSSDGFYYDIHNGYIRPEEVLDNAEQIKEILEALDLLDSFEEALEANDLLIEF